MAYQPVCSLINYDANVGFLFSPLISCRLEYLNIGIEFLSVFLRSHKHELRFLVLVKYPSIYQQGCGKVGCRSTPYHKRQTSQDGTTLPNIDNKTYKQKTPHLYWGKSPKLQTADEGKTHRQIKSSDSQCYRIRTQAVWGFNYTKGKMGNIRGTQLKVIMKRSRGTIKKKSQEQTRQKMYNNKQKNR